MKETMEETKNMKSWSPDDRPREKMMQKGIAALSNAELLAILIGSGDRTRTAVELARDILQQSGNSLQSLARLQLVDLMRFRGMGEAKSISLLSAMELGRRRRSEEVVAKPVLGTSRDAFEHFVSLIGDLPHEEFWVLFLSRSQRVLAVRRISEGGMSATVVDPKKVFHTALEHRAASIIVAHNHPSGNLVPSQDDRRLTARLRKAGELLEMPLLDHLIVGAGGYYSFADEGVLHTE